MLVNKNTLRQSNETLLAEVKKLKGEIANKTKDVAKNRVLTDKISSLEKKIIELNKMLKHTKNLQKINEALLVKTDKMKKIIANLKSNLKRIINDLKEYKKDPKRMDSLYLSIDKNGKIWLIDAITGKNLIDITLKNFNDILSSLTYAHIKYYYTKDSKKSLHTVNIIRQSMMK